MSFSIWLQHLRSAMAPGRGQQHNRQRDRVGAATLRPRVEALEDRLTPSFSPPTSIPFGLAWTVLSADFNHDDRLDLATTHAAVSVSLGDGQGGFGAPSQFGEEEAAWALVAADFNNDGHLDLATLNNDRSVSVLRGNGDGTFGPSIKTAIPHWSMMHSLAAADFDGDGNMDLVYAAEEDYLTAWGSVEVMLGDGQGGFPVRHLYQLNTKNPDGLAVADLNADGRPDVVTTSHDYPGYGYGNSDVAVLLGNGDGTLSYDYGSSLFKTPAYPSNVAVADFTSDGIPDLVASSSYVTGLAVLPGRGDGTFAANFYTPGGMESTPASSMAPADFNGDGHLDILTVEIGSEEYGPALSLFLGRGNGTFEEPEFIDVGGWNSPIGSPDAGDFNADGRPDAAVAFYDYSSGGGGVSVMLNDGDWPPLLPSLGIVRDDVTFLEGNTGATAATFTVTLSAASTETVTVAYATSDGSATAGSDYQAASGTLTFAPGETSKTISVLVTGDRLAEPNETFVVNLSSPTNATVADGQGAGTITDDEPRISISDVSKVEGRKGQTTLFTFTVTLSAAYDEAVTMSFRTVNGTATMGNSDYVAKTGTLTFAPGETTKTITIEVKGDSKREANEYFYLDLFGLSSNSLFTKNRGTGTILNDD